MALFEVDPFEFMTTRRASGNRTYNRGVRHTPSTMSSLPNIDRWHRWASDEQYPRVFTRPPPNSEANEAVELEASESVFVVDDRRNARQRTVLQVNARILHQLTKKLRPFWRHELEKHNLSPDNTTVEFSNSMEEEMNQAIEKKLTSGPPDNDTMNQLTKELFNMIEQRKRENRSVGHIMPGTKQIRDPLIKGVFEIDHESQVGKYHLQYWPMDDPEETRVLNGTLSLKDLKINLTHKYASNKILKKILTIKPHYLSHSKANEVLNSIFTKQTEVARDVRNEDTIPVTESEMKLFIKEESLPVSRGETTLVQRGETKPIVSGKKVAVPRGVIQPILKQESQIVKNTETIIAMKETPLPALRGETKPALREEILLATRGETTPAPRGETLLATRGETKPILKEVTLPTTISGTSEPTQGIWKDDFKKLQETISESRNISSILMNEIEARVSRPQDFPGRKPDEGGGWKLEKRIKDFKPSKPYHPTLPPFVRRWPTFRSKPDTQPVTDSSPQVSTHQTTFSTFLTMRPKYSGPRLKPAFFFSDFQKIGTIYPSTPAAGVTTIKKLGWKDMYNLLGVGISGEVIPSTISPKRLQELWASVEKMFTEKPDLELPTFDEEEKKYFHPATTEEPEVTTEKVETTTIPWFLQVTRRRVTSTTPIPTTTRRSHLHRIKHHVKKGFTKLLNFFGFGDVESEEVMENEENDD